MSGTCSGLLSLARAAAEMVFVMPTGALIFFFIILDVCFWVSLVVTMVRISLFVLFSRSEPFFLNLYQSSETLLKNNFFTSGMFLLKVLLEYFFDFYSRRRLSFFLL